MRAIILAAGQGTRLAPYTDSKPKCMVEVLGRSILERQIDTLKRAGISDIVVVTGYMADEIDFPEVRSCHNKRFESTNMVSSLFCAESELADEDILLVYGDILFSDEVLAAMLELPDTINVAVDLDWQALWEARMEDPLLDAETLKLDENGFITELGKKPKSLSEIEAQYIGLIAIKREFLPKLKDFYRTLDRDALYEGQSFENMYMTSFLTEVLEGLQPLRAIKISGGWLEVDTCQDLETYENDPPPFLKVENQATTKISC